LDVEVIARFVFCSLFKLGGNGTDVNAASEGATLSD
jgi:hypothetical protein